jgi:ADP-heptose:LPS heptosyltransferase
VSLIKTAERLGRRLIVGALGCLLAVRRRQVVLSDDPTILVVRLDERVGNLLMLVPLLDSLRRRFTRARIDVLGSVKGGALLDGHPCVHTYLPFHKWALLAADGPLAMAWRLRRRRYDLVIDAANPTDPSTTQAILVRLSGAHHTVGTDHPGFGRLYSAPVHLTDPSAHEIDLRLALLRPVPGEIISRAVYLARPPPPDGALKVLIDGLNGQEMGIVNVGARIADKMLPVSVYAQLAELVAGTGLAAVITYGPTERRLAEAVCAACPCSTLAPPTSLWQLAALCRRARLVITCDTGPMHIAVATGTPTCGIFLSTDPARFGYREPPHLAVEARAGDWLSAVAAWTQETAAASNR